MWNFLRRLFGWMIGRHPSGERPVVECLEIVQTPKLSDEERRQQRLKKQQGIYYDFRHRDAPLPIEYVTQEVFTGIIDGCFGKGSPMGYIYGQYWFGDTHLRVCPDGQEPTWTPPATSRVKWIAEEVPF